MKSPLFILLFVSISCLGGSAEKEAALRSDLISVLVSFDGWKQMSRYGGQPLDLKQAAVSNLVLGSRTATRPQDNPLVIYYDKTTAPNIMRVAYDCDQNVRIVKRGSREFERLRKIVAGKGIEVAPDGIVLSLKPLTFRFLDEKGNPIVGAFTLIEFAHEKYLSAWYRYHPLEADGSVSLEDTPDEYGFGVTSTDKYYQFWSKSVTVNSRDGIATFTCTPGGAMSFRIVKFPKKYYDSLVVEYHRKTADSTFVQVRGIGIFPDDPKATIGGLAPGDYFLKVKFHYEDKNEIYKSDPFVVSLKTTTELPDITITENDIRKHGF